MNMSRLALTLIIALALFAAGCSKSPSVPDLTPKKLHELYPGDIRQVDYMEIRSGSTGELKSYSDKEQIQEWIASVENIIMVPNTNQEGKVGFLFSVALYEDKQIKLSFTPSSSNKIYYLHNEELFSSIKQLFENK